MKENIKYGVIHEIGEYQEVMPLKEEEVKTLNNDNKETVNETNNK